jgi:hypothetical protein
MCGITNGVANVIAAAITPRLLKLFPWRMPVIDRRPVSEFKQ